MKNELLALLSSSLLALSAQATELKKVPVSAELGTLIKACKTELASFAGRELKWKLSCPMAHAYQIPKNLHGAAAEKYIYTHVGYSQYETKSGGASDRIRNSMQDELLAAIPEIEDGYEETITYYQETTSDLEEYFDSAEKAKLTLWKNDPQDHDGNEAAVMIFNPKTNIIVVVEHFPRQY